jgi:hypothetical protein
MMATVTERIYAAALIALQGIDGVVAVHDRKRVAAFDRADMPCIRLLDGDDSLLQSVGEIEDLREIEISIEIYAHGDQQVDQIDTIRQSAVARIWKSPEIARLSGVVTTGDRPKPDRRESDGLQVREEQLMRISYPVQRDDLSKPV